MFGILVIIILSFLSLVLTRKYLLGFHSANVVFHCTTSSVIKLLDPPGASEYDILAARAIPNKRLIHAFSLTNTFVSADSEVHDVFVGRAKCLLRATRRCGWPYFQNIAIQAAEAALRNAPHYLDFHVFVQDVTLRVALVTLLGVDSCVSELASDDIRVVTELITRLWSLSKKPDVIPSDLLPQLNDHLRRLVPDTETFPNPLDFVIPIWETLWRVVAVTIAHAQNDPLSLEAFADLHLLLTQEKFRDFNGLAPSVEAIIMESMRLHPPSKHITRAMIFPSSSVLHIVQRFIHRYFGYSMRRECADIGALLRSDVWGPDANDFDPSRHHPSRLSPDQEATRSLVFGCGRSRCIAGSWAPMAAGVIVGAMLDRIHCKKDRELVTGPQIGGREGWNGWSIVTQS